MTTLRVIQHVPFEGPAALADWAADAGYHLRTVHPYRGDVLPGPDDPAPAILMGGPMGMGDDARHPWLAEEKTWIRRSVDRGRRLLGICLGAQLLADALGAVVEPMKGREIGWFPVRRDAGWLDSPLAAALPETFTPFHWHGDAFALPDDTLPLGASEFGSCQGFIAGRDVLGLQFHLEATPASVEALLEAGRDELDGSPGVQSVALIRGNAGLYREANRLMTGLLDAFLRPA